MGGNCACLVIVIRRYFNDYHKITIGFVVSILIWRSSISNKRRIYTNASSMSRLYITYTVSTYCILYFSCVPSWYVCTYFACNVLACVYITCRVLARTKVICRSVCSSSLQRKTSRLYKYIKKNKDRERKTSKSIDCP